MANLDLLNPDELKELIVLMDRSEALAPKRAEAMSDYIEDMLVWMSLSEQGKWGFWDVNRFDNARPILPEEGGDEFGFDVEHNARLMGFYKKLGLEERFYDITPQDIWPVARCTVMPGSEDPEEEMEHGVYVFLGAHSMREKERRKIGARWGVGGSHTLVFSEERIWRTGERRSGCNVVNWSPMTGWVNSKKLGINLEADLIRKVCAKELSQTLCERYDWTIDIRSSPKRTGVRLETDAFGAEKILKERDRPEDRNRRPALRHWVAEHWRQTRRDPKMDKKIRDHLRGAESFRWLGYECRINPSPFDIERAAKAKQMPPERRAGAAR